MKISYLMPDIEGRSGGSLVMYHFMDKMSERGHKVCAVTPDKTIHWKPHQWKNALKSKSFFDKVRMDARVLKLKCARLNPYHVINDIGYLTQKLLRHWSDADVTVSTLCYTAYANYLLSGRSRCAHHMQHYEELFFKDPLSQYAARAIHYLPVQFIANSIWLKDLMRHTFGRESFLVNPGIDTSIFNPRVDPQQKYKEKKEWSILTYYSPTDWKGFADAADTVRAVRSVLQPEGIMVSWKVYGMVAPLIGPQTEYEYVGALFNEELAAVYAAADFVLLSSWYESFPLPPLEGMACGTVAVTTRYGTEDYAGDGVNSLVAVPRDTGSMAQKIIAAIRSPERCASLAQKGIETACQCTWEKAADNLERVLTEIAASPAQKAAVDLDAVIREFAAGDVKRMKELLG